MCGIIGKVGEENVIPQLINGLKKLEYRGYDSAGVAFVEDDIINRVRAVGKISELKKKLSQEVIESRVGIGHTRWATHGSPTEENAHPHRSKNGMFYIVHNGIIENSEEIKKNLLPYNLDFESGTDTEVFAHLLEKYYDGEPVSAIAKAQAVLKGSYAFGLICKDYPDVIFGAASGSPLVVVKGENGFYIASDSGAIDEKTVEKYSVSCGEICKITSSAAEFFDPSGKAIKKQREDSQNSEDSFEKEGYAHFMLKEISEQPRAVKDTLDSLISLGGVWLPHVNIDEDFFSEILEKIVIVACGSAYHTGLVAKHIIEKLTGVPCAVEIASEFRYSHPFIDEKTLAIFVSQSGETADTLACLRLAKHCGAQIISIVNVRGSAIAKESDNVIFTKAGREIAVATTKAYSAQLAAFYALSIFIGREKGKLSEEQEEKYIEELSLLPQKIKETLETVNENAKKFAQKICKWDKVFFMGRLTDYATACEGSLKLKEISYINAQSYASGELKHGTISLVEEGTPMIAVLGESKIFSKTLSNICEVESRGAQVIVITDIAKENLLSGNRTVISVPDTLSEFRQSLLVLPLQLISYYTALLRGCDIDQPKNLAKSVTVE